MLSPSDAPARPAPNVQLDGETMRPSPTNLRLLALGADGRRSGVVPTIDRDAEACIARLEECLGRGAAAEVVDFDAHLDEPRKDWTANAAILAV